MAQAMGPELIDVDDLVWPKDVGEMPPELRTHALAQAAYTLLVSTGLGWDGLQPRAISRLSEAALKWFVAVPHECEKTGVWPSAVSGTHRSVALAGRRVQTHRPQPFSSRDSGWGRGSLLQRSGK